MLLVILVLFMWLNKLIWWDVISIQLLRHLTVVAKKVAADLNFHKGYRLGMNLLPYRVYNFAFSFLLTHHILFTYSHLKKKTNKWRTWLYNVIIFHLHIYVFGIRQLRWSPAPWLTIDSISYGFFLSTINLSVKIVNIVVWSPQAQTYKQSKK